MSASFNLPKATQLWDVIFRPGSLRVEWITLAPQVVAHKSRDLRQISVIVPSYLAQLYVNEVLRQAIGEGVLGEWVDLDRILVHL